MLRALPLPTSPQSEQTGSSKCRSGDSFCNTSRGWKRSCCPALRRAESIDTADVILKVDVEDAEWDVFSTSSVEQLRRFSQIICELHGFNCVEDDTLYQKMASALGKLNELFCVIHVHGNNCAPTAQIGGVAFPEVLEVTYASRKRYQFEPSAELFPTEIDEPNEPSLPDY